jgi:E3 ubiquitin-protein ligase UHRF1
MSDLPCDGDGVCMVCHVAAPPEVDLLRCTTCATPWHSPCLSKPPALSDAATWSCPDCSGDAAPAPRVGSDLVAAIRAIEDDTTLSEQEKAKRRQALLAPSADSPDDAYASDSFDDILKTFKCVFCVSLPERPVTVFFFPLVDQIGSVPIQSIHAHPCSLQFHYILMQFIYFLL